MASRRSVTAGFLSRLAEVAALAAGLGACSPRLDPLPQGAEVTCSSSSDCPEGWFCQTTIGQCVRSDAAGTPPAVVAGSASLDHSVARGGAAVVAAFTVSADLAAPPLVELGTPGVRTAFAQKKQDGHAFEFSLLLGQDAPEGTFPVLATLVGSNGAIATDQPLGNLTVDSTPPAISRLDTLTPAVSAGQVARLELTFGEALPQPPQARFEGALTAILTAEATAQPQVWRFSYTATGVEPEGPATVVVEARDAAGNLATRTAVDALVLDFTRPRLATGPDVATPVVRPGQQVVVRISASEPLDQDPAAQLVGRASGTVLPLAVAERVGTGFTFGRLVLPGDPSETYDVRVTGLVDLAGNAGDPVSSGAVRVDSTPPAVTAGPTLGKASGQYRSGEIITVSFTASEDLAGPPGVRLTTSPPLAFTCAEGAPRVWSCQLPSPLTGAERPETAVNVVVELVDQAGNVGSTSATAVLDFTPPGVVAGSVGLTLFPPPGALVPAVSTLGTGGKVRVTFTVDEPLSADPSVATTAPEVISCALVSQAATTYTYETTLSGSHAQGAYTLAATLTDRAGNVARPVLTGPGRTLTVDTVAPASPGVGVPSRVVYDRVPWGSTATGGRSSFSVIGGTGAAEAGATVVAYDGANPASANEIARGTALASGAFGLALSGGDRREVFVLAVDGAGNASDGDGATAGPQAVRVRDVTWTATLGGKLPESTIENPHALEARNRWLGSVRQGASVEKALPAESTGALAWASATGAAWPANASTLVQDPLRGVLIAFRSDVAELAEFDGWRWRITPFTEGPQRVYSAVFDPRRAEVVVYADPCVGGTVLWSWNGARWKPLATGASWTQWLAGGVAGPGPHSPASLVLDERSGDLLLSMSYYVGDPYVCGDVGGRMDYQTYRWDGAAWTAFAVANNNGGPFGYDPVRGVTVRRDSTGVVQEWNGTAWGTVALGDPEGDGNPSPTAIGARFTWDPASGRLITLASGSAWAYTGTSFRLLGAASQTALGTDFLGGRLLGLTLTALSAWNGSAFVRVAAPAVTISPVGMVWNASARRMEAIDATGAVYRFDGGAWGMVTPTDPQGDGNPGALTSATLDPSRGGAFACASGGSCWWWNGSSWALQAVPTTSMTLVGLPGVGILAVASGAQVWQLTGSTWTQVETNGVSPYWAGNPVHSPALGGIVLPAKINPFGPDNILAVWSGSGAWTRPFTAAGYGLVRPLAADGSGRTFALHDSVTTYLAGASPIVQVASVENPFAIAFPTLTGVSAWSPDDRAVYLAGGPSTYRLETEASSRPGHLLRFAYPSSGGPDLHTCMAGGAACPVSRVELGWSGVATGNRTNQGSSATLWLLDGPRWIPLASATSSTVAGHASATGVVTDPNLIGRMAFGPGSEIVAAVTVDSNTLSASSLLRTEDVSLKVTYRLP
jgi:hypothetical protein